MKKIISTMIFVVCVLLFFVACGRNSAQVEMQWVTTTHGRYPPYHSIEEITLVADYVVRVEVLDERVEKLDILLPPENELQDAGGEQLEYYYEIFTVYRLKVLGVFQGDINIGDIMDVRLLGGQYGNEQLIAPDYTYFTAGEELVLFLHASTIGLPPFPLNPFQGMYYSPSSVEGAMSRYVGQALEGVNPYGLELTYGDLVHIWISNLDANVSNPRDIGDIQIATYSRGTYILDDLSHMSQEEILSLDITEETLQAILDSGIMFQGG